MGKRDCESGEGKTIYIYPYLFDGPFDDPQSIAAGAGIVAVLAKRKGRYTVVEAAESVDLQAYVTSAARLKTWAKECCGDPFLFAVIYTPKRSQKERARMKDTVRKVSDAQCDTSDEHRPRLIESWFSHPVNTQSHGKPGGQAGKAG